MTQESRKNQKDIWEYKLAQFALARLTAKTFGDRQSYDKYYKLCKQCVSEIKKLEEEEQLKLDLNTQIKE